MAILRQQAAFIDELYASGIVNGAERQAMQASGCCFHLFFSLSPEVAGPPGPCLLEAGETQTASPTRSTHASTGFMLAGTGAAQG